MANHKYASIIGTLGQLSDRFMTCGYRDDEDAALEGMLATLKDLDVMTGAELSYSSQGPMSDAVYVSEALAGAGFIPTFVNSSLFGERVWQAGSLTAADPAVRERALAEVLRGLDFTRAVGGEGFNLWLGQDGFDYPFQTRYGEQWKWLIQALRVICDYDKSLKIALEPKLREPRNRALIDTVPTALLICREVDRENIGLTIDVGHTLQAGGNIAQNIELAAGFGKLFNLHVNDNYAAWDDDMIVGSVHFLEYLEMMYALRKTGYEGWISVDIFPFRENPYGAVRESILYMKAYDRMVDKIGVERLDRLVLAGDATELLRVVREEIFG